MCIKSTNAYRSFYLFLRIAQSNLYGIIEFIKADNINDVVIAKVIITVITTNSENAHTEDKKICVHRSRARFRKVNRMTKEEEDYEAE